jgi:hypothetical protein
MVERRCPDPKPWLVQEHPVIRPLLAEVDRGGQAGLESVAAKAPAVHLRHLEERSPIGDAIPQDAGDDPLDVPGQPRRAIEPADPGLADAGAQQPQ